MQEQTSSELATASGNSGAQGWLSSVTQLGPRTWVALALTFLGWFALDTLHVEWGPLRQGIRFYDMADVIGRPARLFTGLEANRGGITTVLFILVCTAALLAPWGLSLRRNRFAWLGWLAPLAVMVCVACLLKTRTSGDLLHENAFIDTLGNDVRHLTNHLLRGASSAIAQKVTLAAGGYLALASSAYLAWLGIQRTRTNSALDQEAS